MSSSECASLHDVYESLDQEEQCQKTSYMLQFLWRDLSSYYDVLGPYFTLSSTADAKYLHSVVVKTMLVFHQFSFHVRALLCDGASSNLALLKVFCNHKEGNKLVNPYFISPFDGQKVHLIICPYHQVCILH